MLTSLWENHRVSQQPSHLPADFHINLIFRAANSLLNQQATPFNRRHFPSPSLNLSK
jgi:hypothetical protein